MTSEEFERFKRGAMCRADIYALTVEREDNDES